MDVIKIILNGKKEFLQGLSVFVTALIAPNELRTKKQIEIVKELLTLLNSENKSRQQIIEWKIKIYEQLGLSSKEIKEKLISEIEKSVDLISILMNLIKKGMILNIEIIEITKEKVAFNVEIKERKN